jgi:hypothetical protein
MTGEEVFAAWAPETGRWSPWVKPVLFAHVDETVANHMGPLPAARAVDWPEWATPAGTALLIELPGMSAVAMGQAAAEMGFQPVPLFNALPGPAGHRVFEIADTTRWAQRTIPLAAVDVHWTILALVAAAPRLRGGGMRGRGLPPETPPAFLVDALRLDSRGPLVAGRFDNRSAHTVSDVPSAARLREGGVERVVFISEARSPGWDLLPILERWRSGGLVISCARPGAAPQPWPGQWGASLWRAAAWLRRLTLTGNGRRGFGGWSSASAG